MTQSCTVSFLILTEHLSLKRLLVLLLLDPSDDGFVINSISSRAAAATWLRCPSWSWFISNFRDCACISISRRCLAMHNFASCCFSSSSFISLDISNSRWHQLDIVEEAKCEPDLEWREEFCSAVSLSWTERVYPRAAALNSSVCLLTVANHFSRFLQPASGSSVFVSDQRALQSYQLL